MVRPRGLPSKSRLWPPRAAPQYPCGRTFRQRGTSVRLMPPKLFLSFMFSRFLSFLMKKKQIQSVGFCLLWNSYSYGEMGSPSRGAPGTLPDTPRARPGRYRTPPRRYGTPPCAQIPAERHIDTPHAAKHVVTFAHFLNIFVFAWKFSGNIACFELLWNSHSYGGMGTLSRDAPGRSLAAPGLPSDAPGTLSDATGRAHSGQEARWYASYCKSMMLSLLF